MGYYIVNKFNEVVPVTGGRVSLDTRNRRDLTDFEMQLLNEIEELEKEIEELKSETDRLKEIEWQYNKLCK